MALSGHFQSGPRCASYIPPTCSSPQNSQIEILYSLPDARIVEFKPTNISSDHVSPEKNTQVYVEPGSLSWTSRFERTIAVGSLQIYRAPGSVAFLNCQNSIRPILPKSQAWCVDADSKFVLRSPPLFWRIEIPNTNLVEIQRAQELKQVFSQILRFDKTPCPFKREIFVQPLGSPQTPPARKQKLRPIQRQKSEQYKNTAKLKSPENLVTEISGRKISGKILKPHVYPESPPVFSLSLDGKDKHSDRDSWGSVSRSLSASSQLSVQNLRLHEKSNPLEDATKRFDPISALYLDDMKEKLSDKPDVINSLTSDDCFTETVENYDSYGKPNLKSDIVMPRDSPLKISLLDDSRSEVSSTESFHSFQTWHSLLDPPSPLTRSPPQLGISSYSCLQDKLILTNYSNHARGISEQNIEPENSPIREKPSATRNSNERRSLPILQIPALYDDQSDKSEEECQEISTPLSAKSSRFALTCQSTPINEFRRRKLSPVPTAVSQRMHQIVTQIPTSIIQKTFEVLLSPPSNLFHSMLRIASRITAGEWRGVFSSYGEAVHWDFEDDYRNKYEYEDNFKSYLSGITRSNEISFSGLEVD